MSAEPHAIEHTQPLARKRISLNAVAGKLESQFQNIAACRIFNLYGCIRISNNSGIARMLEVIENLRRIHSANLGNDLEGYGQLAVRAFACDCRNTRISVIRNKSVSSGAKMH